MTSLTWMVIGLSLAGIEYQDILLSIQTLLFRGQLQMWHQLATHWAKPVAILSLLLNISKCEFTPLCPYLRTIDLLTYMYFSDLNILPGLRFVSAKWWDKTLSTPFSLWTYELDRNIVLTITSFFSYTDQHRNLSGATWSHFHCFFHLATQDLSNLYHMCLLPNHRAIIPH